MNPFRAIRLSHRSLGSVVVAALAVACAAVVQGATVNVSTTVDVVDGNVTSVAALQATPGGAGISLREAVRAVNNDPGGPHIISIPAGTYTLSLAGADDTALVGDLDVLKAVTVTGAGSATTIIRGGTTTANGVDKIFSLNPLGNRPGFPVSMSGVTLRFGRNTDPIVAGGNNIGGAMDFDAGFGANFNGLGTLTLNDVIFDQNSTTNGDGGALALFDGGTVTLTNCQFTTNRAVSNATNAVLGGGIFVGFGAGHATNYTFNTCTITGNSTAGTTPAGGGGFFSFAGGMNFHGCTISNNSANGASSDGGGISGIAPLTIDQGTIITGNTATRWGGGIFATGLGLSISNTTITNNTGSGNGTTQGFGGGGIFTAGINGTATVSNCRIAGNVSPVGGSQLGCQNGDGATMNAINNWFGTNAPPASFFGVGVTASPNLVLAVTAAPATVVVAQTSTVTAAITKNSSNVSGFTVPNGTPVSYSAVLGTMSPVNDTLTSGTDTSTFTAGATAGSGSASATVDSQTISAGITINQPPAITSANATTFIVGSAGTFTVTRTGVPTPTLSMTGTLPGGVTFVAATGVLSGTPAAGTAGTYNLVFTASNGVGSNAVQNFTLTVNGPPVVSNVAVATNEDTTLTFTAANFTGSYSDPNSDPLASVRITSLPANGVLKVGAATVASVPTDVAIGSIGTLTFVPNLNYNGPASFGWNGFDGTLFAVAGATVNITVNAVNDAPSFTKGADQGVLEDSGVRTVNGWATALSAGPADEGGQALNFIVGNNNPGLFTLQPAIAANGTLTFTPAANANGSATVTVQIHDNGGVVNGGVDTSAAQTFLITVTAVNDAPGFTKGADQTVNEDAGAQSVPGWATALSAGPADEVGQALNFIVSNNNNALFSAQPAVAANGTLTYTAAANANGSAIVTVQLHDSGGVLNGGADTSAPQTFLITVTAVNDVPSFTKGADQTVNEDALAQTVPGWATALSVGPANEAGQVLNFIVGNNNPALFSLQPAIAANGTLTYTPAANANGSATVTVQIHDNGGVLNGGVDTSAAQTFTITVTAFNDPPVITAQAAAVALAQGHSRTIFFTDLTVTDPDNTYPTGFTLTVQNGANYSRVANTITPTPGFVGTLSVPVQVNDGTANSNVFNLVVTVNPNAEQVATNATIAPESGGGFRVSFLGAPGASYTIQFTNSLAPVNWQTLGTAAAAANGRYSLVDLPPVNTPMRFYRSTEPYLNDFGNGLGAATLRGSAVLTNSAVKLTDEVTGGAGAVVFEGLVPGPALNGFTARFNLAIGPISFGVPADGVSFAVGNLGVGTWGETGPGTPNSLAVGFDTYDNGSAEGNIGLHVWVNGVHLALNGTNPYSSGATVPVEIRYDTATGLTVRFNSVLIFTNLPIAGFTFPATDGRFGISARTGGFSERAVVDDVEITPR